MAVRSFFDTNILVYADDQSDREKQAAAQGLLERHIRAGVAVLSTQVLQEFFVAATRKLGVPAAVARAKVDIYGRCDVAVIQVPDIVGAIDLHRLHGLSFWDGLIVRCAQQAGCRVLYTEDLNDGQSFDGLTVVNPFRP